MATKVINNISIENAKILFPNFNGIEKEYNSAGERNFCVMIEDPVMAQQLKRDGWNIRISRPRDPEDTPYHYLQVKVGFERRPPHIHLCKNGVWTDLDEETVGELDYADIANVDLTIRPYEWEPGRIKAYLKTMYVTLEEDEFAHKYAANADPF